MVDALDHVSDILFFDPDIIHIIQGEP